MADGWCHLLFNISETQYVSKKLTTVVTITSKVFINKGIKKYIAISPQPTTSVTVSLHIYFKTYLKRKSAIDVDKILKKYVQAYKQAAVKFPFNFTLTQS